MFGYFLIHDYNLFFNGSPCYTASYYNDTSVRITPCRYEERLACVANNIINLMRRAHSCNMVQYLVWAANNHSHSVCVPIPLSPLSQVTCDIPSPHQELDHVRLIVHITDTFHTEVVHYMSLREHTRRRRSRVWPDLSYYYFSANYKYKLYCDPYKISQMSEV